MTDRDNVRIVIRPDAPAVLAQRLVRRLQRDHELAFSALTGRRSRSDVEALIETLADEIHQAAVDGTVGGVA